MNNPKNSNQDFTKENYNSKKYQIIRELGRHQEGIYINYLAQNNITNQSVILTHFILAQPLINTGENNDYKTIFELLQSLEHQGIPHHLDCFQSENGFCLVQEYHPSEPLTSANQWTLEEIKKIAISALEILVYLQEQTPPIFHHQIRPDTLFVDSNFQVYLIDFGFAQIGDINFPLYSMMNKNQGFTPPEQKRGRVLTKNSDLYSLGVTLFCLIARKEASKVNTLIGMDGSFNVQGLISNQMSLTWIEWLGTMVAINPQHRYPDAITALNIIKNVDINRLPDVKFIPERLELKANDYGEIITQNVTIINPVIDTKLLGKWEIGSSTYDVNTKGFHPWISFDPLEFEGNKTNCQITINTGKLKTNKIYLRKLILKDNSSQKNHVLSLRIETAKIKNKNLINLSLIVLLIISLGCGWFSGIMVGFTPDLINWLALISGLKIGSVGGYGASFSKINLLVKAVASITSISVIVGLVGLGSDLDLLIGFVVGFIVTCTAGMVIKFYLEKKIHGKLAITLACLTASFGLSFGIDLTLPIGNSLLLLIILGTGLPLMWMLLNPYWQYQQRLNRYRKQERSLIKS